ncbi:hypothetical protein BJX66DRAFT_44523 [Aspergillus keveii]|uniref:Uncharacterized protein n=1 Tax=Aspergillus keveii TaxID=714993 RepID=A0ABR4GH60_9EURO
MARAAATIMQRTLRSKPRCRWPGGGRAQKKKKNILKQHLRVPGNDASTPLLKKRFIITIFFFLLLLYFFLLLFSFVYQNRTIEGSVGFERIYG